ncbi:Floricaula/leafy protein [Trema orientale]|uniref:Floricaula/leafy-like transcription factor n=1 Tax=Trema orientale TaxID=63057 RepID=A0A2P5FI56_TREOI|nr:Floricaula/leafy protein [Trema orientale]
MDPDPFTASLFKWDPRGLVSPTTVGAPQLVPAAAYVAASRPAREFGGLEELFQAYGIRYYTVAKIAELGFTVRTLVNMRDEELDDMMNSLSHIFRWELLVGERYGIKAAVRAERRRLEDDYDFSRRRSADTHTNVIDALSQEGLSEEPVQQEKEMVGSGGGGGGVGGRWDQVVTAAAERRNNNNNNKKKQRRRSSKGAHSRVVAVDHNNNIHELVNDMNDVAAEDEEDDDDDDDEDNVVFGKGSGRGGSSGTTDHHRMSCERQREHPFIVTEPGEVARGKKNGLDYLFHLYEQCRDFLIQVQNIAKERGDKCPTKLIGLLSLLVLKCSVGQWSYFREDYLSVLLFLSFTVSLRHVEPPALDSLPVTNEVFRYAKKAGASHINKPKMRHYVHCYALHCLDEEGSNALRRAYKERGENVGAWRQACYKPLVAIAARQAAWDIDSIFNAHPRLSIWYVPTKLRQLCHAERNAAVTPSMPTSATACPASAAHHLTF